MDQLIILLLVFFSSFSSFVCLIMFGIVMKNSVTVMGIKG